MVSAKLLEKRIPFSGRQIESRRLEFLAEIVGKYEGNLFQCKLFNGSRTSMLEAGLYLIIIVNRNLSFKYV